MKIFKTMKENREKRVNERRRLMLKIDIMYLEHQLLIPKQLTLKQQIKQLKKELKEMENENRRNNSNR